MNYVNTLLTYVRSDRLNKVFISFEEDYPSWSDICLDNSKMENIENYIHDLIVCIEWSCDKKVKAIRIESVDNTHDPIYHVVKNNKIGKKEGFKNGTK